MGDLLPEVAVRAGREVAVPVRGRRPGRPRLHVLHRHRRHRRRQVSRRRPLGQVREMGRECGVRDSFDFELGKKCSTRYECRYI